MQENKVMHNYYSLHINLKDDFSWRASWIWLMIFALLLLRLFWCVNFPMANDEVYYWDWSRHLQLSYVDAPPFVAWVSYLGGLIFHGSLGARCLVPFIYTATTLFIVLCSKKFAQILHYQFSNEAVLGIMALTQLTPIFNTYSIFLLPDSTLLFGIFGALYFLLKALHNCISKNQNTMSIKYALLFGLFIGIAGLSKYHALPIFIGFYLATVLFRGIKQSIKDIPFWVFAAIFALVVTSPVFVWNYLNNFASFRFQSDHGFANFSFKIKPFLIYLTGCMFYLLPWFFVILFWYAVKNIYKGSYLRSIHFASILPFFILFFLILFSSFGKQALPHWVIPGFMLLIPSFCVTWKPFTGVHKNIWKWLTFISIIICIFIPSLLSIQGSRQIIINTFTRLVGNADGLFQVFAWQTLQEDLEKQQNIKIISRAYEQDNAIESCQDQYRIASLNWYWTSQIAFYFKNQPKVYNLNFNKLSFFAWRDDISKLAKCKFIILASANHFDREAISKIMDIEEVNMFYLYPYHGQKIVYVRGVLKEESILKQIMPR